MTGIGEDSMIFRLRHEPGIVLNGFHVLIHREGTERDFLG